MPPKFALQPVLDYRHSRVEALEIALAELLAQHQQLQNALTQLQGLGISIMIELSEKQTGVLDLFALQQLRGNLRAVEERTAQVQQALDELAARVEAKRQEIVTARQDEETLKTLKEKEIVRFKEEQAVMEGRQMDDVYIAQAFRARQAGEARL